MRRKARHIIEAIAAYFLYGLSWALPTTVASALGALIGDIFFYAGKGRKVARKNLQRVLPEVAAEHEQIIRGMWRNMGRVIMEYPHLGRLWESGRVELIGADFIKQHSDKPCVLVGAHLANWELGPLITAKHGWNMAAIYRPLNNPYTDALLRFARKADARLLFPKSAEGGMALMRHVRAGGNAGLLMDQRLGDGVTVPFFGIPVLAPPIAAVLALKYNAVLIPTQVERLGGCRFRVTVHPTPTTPTEGTEAERTTQLTADLYKLFEGWIRHRPDQWLWMHDRWRGAKK